MQSDTYSQKENSLGSVLKDIGLSAKEIIRSELELIKFELRSSAEKVGKHSAQIAVFGSLAILSILPFMAFLVIALGKYWNERYWLSSLVVAIAFSVIGGSLAYRAFNKIKHEDVGMFRSREGLGREIEALREKLQQIKMATNRRTT